MGSNLKEGRRLLIVSGLSGAGKSVVLNTLEDLGFYCIDNLPINLFDHLIQLIIDSSSNLPTQIGVGIDARSPTEDLSALPGSIALLRSKKISTEIVFIEASKNILTSRFSETRRKHPLSSDEISLDEAIDRERAVLSILSDMADLRLDTSHTSVHELRNNIRGRLAQRSADTLSMQFVSFGFKHGVPRDADFIFDVRCLPNPHWEKQLRPYSGKDQVVIDFLKQQPSVTDMLNDIQTFLTKWAPQFEAENRSYLCIAVGCTGGHHRSVYFVEELSRKFEQQGKHILVKHRDL